MEGKKESYEFTNVVHKVFGDMKWNFIEVPWNDKKPFTTKELDDIVGSCISVCRISPVMLVFRKGWHVALSQQNTCCETVLMFI
nr:hypothetical protein [Tanacetum cinerariifolium]